jgi:alkanesulfonate monooxygenase
MTGSRRLHLGAFMRPVGIHTAWWRYPGAYPDANFNLQHLVRFAQTLERGRFDAWFMADHLAVLNMPMAALKRSATVTSFDPLTPRFQPARPPLIWSSEAKRRAIM